MSGNKSVKKFCRDCHWKFWISYNRKETESYACNSPQNAVPGEVSLVTGEPYRAVSLAESARQDDYLCGSDGKWYESEKEFAARYYAKASIRAPSLGRNQPVTLEGL